MILKVIIAFIVSLFLVLLVMPKWITFLKKLNFNQVVSEYSLQEFKDKAKTPIMGGVLFTVSAIAVTVVLGFKELKDINLLIVLLSFIGYGLIGFVDDYIIVIKHDNEGLKPKQKFLMQLILAIFFFVIYRNHVSLLLEIPVLHKTISLSYFYALLVFFMFTGASNAVNLTDGMDGLAAGCSVFSYAAFLVFAILEKETGIAIFIAALIGALIGYLYYNVEPARIFMGDTGSLALGGGLAAIAMVTKHELLLVIIGGVFVWETLCVVIQISSVKIRKKRVFKYTPIHYSFVIDGYKKKAIVHQFWLLSMICALAGVIIGCL